jgi:acetylornithine aminotransferase
MNLFNVYPLYDIEPIKGENCYIYDNNNNKYLDLYGGHAVISIGHSHPHYVEKLKKQTENLVFYSNSIQNGLQKELAQKLGELSDYKDYNLFLCNSGAEANENALKLASFANGRKKIIAFKNCFHGRTSLAVACTDNKNIVAPVNENENIIFCELNNIDEVESYLKNEDISSVIIEGIFGVGGITIPESNFLKQLQEKCKQYGTYLILDEIQSGYGRTGKFFAHQHAEIKADIISMAKGMGNGFPIGGIIISPEIEAKFGMLGTTFGGNHLACAAGIAVLDVLKNENLISKAKETGDYLMSELKKIKEIKEVIGEGLMIGCLLEEPIAELRKKLLFDYKVFTGAAKNPCMLRILPPLTISKKEVDIFLEALKACI